MTRFARAKGSKASNERVAEEATSWHEMKRQLLDKEKERNNKEGRKEADEARKLNYKEFLREHEESTKAKLTWTEFTADNKTAGKKVDAKKGPACVMNVKKVSTDKVDTKRSSEGNMNVETDVKMNVKKDSAINVNAKNCSVGKASIKKGSANKVDSIKCPTNKVDKENSSTNKQSKMDGKKRNNRKKLKKTASTKLDSNNPAKVVVKKPIESLTKEELKKFEKKKQKRLRQAEKRKKFKEERLLKQEEADKNTNQTEDSVIKTNGSNGDGFTKKFIRKPSGLPNKSSTKRKIADKNVQTQHKRRKPDMPDKITVEGREIGLAYYEGFPIKKEDYERLTTLRKQMISKGLPRSEIKIALKLERRRAEKALAREKKKVCFNCRKFGHNLSECPELNNSTQFDETTASGICFKCGSTEHTHFECKVVRGENFKFAKCFICNEQGHIARQCPDNARGLYPKGGACKLCGDVTHFKKDCPTMQIQQEQENVIVETIDNNNIESLHIGDNQSDKKTINKPKHVRF